MSAAIIFACSRRLGENSSTTSTAGIILFRVFGLSYTAHAPQLASMCEKCIRCIGCAEIEIHFNVRNFIISSVLRIKFPALHYLIRKRNQ